MGSVNHLPEPKGRFFEVSEQLRQDLMRERQFVPIDTVVRTQNPAAAAGLNAVAVLHATV